MLGGLFDGVGVGVFAVILLRALDLETADGVEVVGMTLVLLEGVLMGDLLWMILMLLGLFLMMGWWRGHGVWLLRFLEFWSVRVCLVLGLASCAVSHRFNLNTQRYMIHLRLNSRFYQIETTGINVLERKDMLKLRNGKRVERVGQSIAG